MSFDVLLVKEVKDEERHHVTNTWGGWGGYIWVAGFGMTRDDGGL